LLRPLDFAANQFKLNVFENYDDSRSGPAAEADAPSADFRNNS
jgi:hypothetical protein